MSDAKLGRGRENNGTNLTGHAQGAGGLQVGNRVWTSSQQDAISASGGSLLVSAAAGSGKTAVLVERAIGLLCDGNIPADRLLVVTFSNAAAAEMKSRMNARLSAMIAKNPADLHLQRQQALLAGAQISTIHSFCLELIWQNFQHLDISPDFSIADQNELELIRADCMRDCIEEFYLNDVDGGFVELVELLSTGKDDGRVAEVALKIYEFARSHPFYLHWLAEKQGMYADGLPAQETVWGRVILDYAADSLAYCRNLMTEAVSLASLDLALEKGYLSAFSSDLAQIEDCLAAVGSGQWDEAAELLANFDFARLGAVRGSDGLKERAKSLRDKSKGVIEELRDRALCATAAEFSEDIADLAPKIGLLFSLVAAFDARFRAAKSDKRRVDFQDLEHLALELLVERNGTSASSLVDAKENRSQKTAVAFGCDDLPPVDSYHRTRLAGEIAARYAVVMVDEYQDTNEVQDMIFSCVSDSQRNLFMVGDVKQSIYSFRQAMPEIFLSKKRNFFKYERDLPQFPAKIILDMNFRSRSSVTDGVNYLFRLLMSRKLGDMDYTGEEELRCGAVYPEHTDVKPELVLLDGSGCEEASDDTRLEAAYAANRIACMLDEGYPVSDGGGLRSCTPRDFCILIRSPRGRADTYVKELAERGIPALAERDDGYLSTREVSAAVSFLEALDNPLLDVELVAAMSSPLFDFSDDDLARIRLTARGVPFYTALHAAADNGDGKSAAFLELFHRLRRQAAMLSPDDLLLKLYDETDALAVVRAMPQGETRGVNLMLLAEYAAKYHVMGYKGLAGFVGFLARLKERGGDLPPVADTGEAGANAVRILSIHRSKGLEFPIVLLCDTFRRFNKTDLRSGSLLHSRLGFACMRRDHESRGQFATLPMQAIRLETERAMLSEELRVLYVALTRPKEKLIISGFCKTDPARRLGKLHTALSGDRLPEYAVREACCFADWLLMALMHHPSGGALRELAGCTDSPVAADQNPWRITVEPPVSGEIAEVREPVLTAVPDAAMLEQIRARTRFVYPYLAQTAIPTKLAVSAVAKGKTELTRRFATRPAFMSRTMLTGAEKGNALHKFMQFADYHAAWGDLDGEIKRMSGQKFLTPAEADSLSRRQLKKFFGGALFGQMLNSPKLMRELRFTAECGAEIVGDWITGLGSDDKIVLQGVADCVFFELDGAVIVDYKTDLVDNEAELVERYQAQLILYKRILERSLGVPVKGCVLYSFALGREVWIK